MNIRYFLVADVAKRQHVTIEYCPTDEMIGDFFTKPLGGAKFRRFRNIIMNISHDEYGPVDVDALMTVHNEEMQKRIDVVSQHENEYDDEPIISKCSNPAAGVNSQECGGDVIFAPNDTISVEKRTNVMWVEIRGVHKIRRKNQQSTKGSTNGLFYRRSNADVAAASAH